MTWVHLNAKSGNRKVGPIAVSTTEEASCPTECPLKGTDCYARFGPLGMHWAKIGHSRGDNWTAFCKRIARLPRGSKFRHNQAGDLPQRKDGRIHRSKLAQLVRAVKTAGLQAWTYTHYSPSGENLSAIRKANDAGFVINLSADSLEQADLYAETKLPVTVVLPENSPHRGNATPGGLPIVVCPAQTVDSMDCAACMLCQKKDRKSIVGFLAHGTAKKRLSARIAGSSGLERGE